MKWLLSIVFRWVTICKRALGAFLNTNEGDTVAETGWKISGAIARRVMFLQLDYVLTATGATIAVTLHSWHPFDGWVQILFVFVSLWLFELGCAIPFILTWRRTGIDMTLAADARRANNQLFSDSKVAGRIGYTFFLVKGIVWDGPEEIIIFFYKEIQDRRILPITLLVISAVQAALWGFVFIWGYETLKWLFSLI